MPQVLIIAYGNPLRCDDGVAWRAAEELARANLSEDVEIITRYQLMPELAADVSQVSLVVFVDAGRNGVPGQVVSARTKPQRQSSAFTHEFSPASILGLAQELYGRCPEAFSVSVCGERFDHGEGISTKVTESLPDLIAAIKRLVVGKVR
jgi:hydrogenase maturation protease